MNEDLFDMELAALQADNQPVVDLIAEVREGRETITWLRGALATAQARVAALERVLVDVDSVLKRAQDTCDRAEQPARAQDCYIARQQIAALFPPPD